MISNIAFTFAHQQVIYNVSLAFYANAAAQAHLATAAKSLWDADSHENKGADAHGRICAECFNSKDCQDCRYWLLLMAAANLAYKLFYYLPLPRGRLRSV